MSEKSEEPGSLGGLEEKAPSGALALLARFEVPPFSTLNAADGDWQKRKRAWLALGIKSERDRKDNLQGMSDTVRVPDPEKRAAMIAAGEEIKGGTSIFDPVLCEFGIS
jgi:hypothetical protein